MNDKKKLGQEPAYPIDLEHGYSSEHSKDMSKRFRAACMAMQGQISKYGLSIELSRISRDIEYSLLYADELLKQENDDISE